MIRARFITRADDYRPINWPIKHPYWCTGSGEDGDGEYNIIVAYADDEAEIMRNWPEAECIAAASVNEYSFTSRFRKPDWFKPQPPEATP